jgi:glycosyltransferase involved in cell wall biosynthesis
MGSHSFIRREVQALERLGVEVLRFAMRPPPTPPMDALNASEHARCEYVLSQGKPALVRAVLHNLRPGSAGLRLALRAGAVSEQGRARHLIYWAEACYIALRCRAEGVDHLHAHFGTNAATVAMLVSEMTGLPFSFTVHGPEEFDQPRALFLSEKMRRAAFTVGISQFGRSQLCRWVEPQYWKRIKVVHCGIEPAAFPPPRGVPAGPVRLVNIGRFAEQKGQVNLIEALAQLRADLPDVHLTLIGDGEMRGILEAAVRSHGLEAQVTFTGWVDEDRIRAELDHCHAMVLPSFAEGLPMVVMEAMAAGRPVIATYIAGNPELVQDGKTGWLVPAGDVGALADAVRALACLSTEQMSEMGLAGRKRVFARHDIDDQAALLAGHFGTR